MNIIAIDPDVSENGVCIVNKEKREIYAMKIDFPNLLKYVTEKYTKEDTCIVVECGYLNKTSNYHASFGNVRVSAKIGYSVGRNHECSYKLIETFRFLGYRVKELKPLIKGGKITQNQLNLELDIRNFPAIKKTNQDIRDAIQIAIYCSDREYLYK